MMAVALKGLLGRKTRTVLTAFAIVLGVAMVSGTYVLTDTIQKAFNGVFQSSYRNTSVVVSGKELVKGARSNPVVPVSLLARVRALPDVAAAAGTYLGDIPLVDRTGKTMSAGGAPNFGFGVDARNARFSPISLVAGRYAATDGEIVIDKGAATKHGYAIGDLIGAKDRDGVVHSFRIVGLGEIAGVSIGGATFAGVDLPEARSLLGRDGFDQVSVAVKPGVAPARVAAEIRPFAPATVQVRTAAAQARADAQSVAKGTSVITYFLLTFGAIALFVGAFVIFNTISITVAQRTRELATLRTIGASRRQVLRSVLVESGAIGVIGALVGLVSGLGLARLLNALFIAIGVDLPHAGTVIATRTIVVSLLVGPIVTLAAGLFPAIRATRVPAISAVREGAQPPKARRPALRPVIAGVLVVIGLAVIVNGLFVSAGVASTLELLGVGTLVLFGGVAMMSSYLVAPLVGVVGAPSRRIGGAAGRIASANALRNPGRTASTAAALMIGLALVAFVATLGAGLQHSSLDALNTQVSAQYVMSPTSMSTMSFSPAIGNAITSLPELSVASGVETDNARIFGTSTGVAGVDPATIGRLYRFGWKQGSNAVLAHLGNGAIVDSVWAKKHALAVGSTFSYETSNGLAHVATVAATYRAPQAQPVMPPIVIGKGTFDRVFPQPEDVYVLASAANGVTDAELTHALAAFPDVTLDTKASWVSKQSKSVNTVLDLFYVLLALSVVISLFGMVNTLVLVVFERTRELGMLRAIGMTRRQVRRMIRHESIVTALIGAALGLPLGVFLAALVTRGLSSLGVGFHLPAVQLVVFAWIAVVAGLAAAVFPARRASRLNVLEALQYE